MRSVGNRSPAGDGSTTILPDCDEIFTPTRKCDFAGLVSTDDHELRGVAGILLAIVLPEVYACSSRPFSRLVRAQSRLIMMKKLRILALGVVVSTSILPTSCEAYVRRLRLPLAGHSKYAVGKGTVMFSQNYADAVRDGGGSLIVEVNNVPLPSGTNLEVVVHGKQVGTLVLDKSRNGRMVLASTTKQAIPQLTEASIVTVRLPAGAKVLW